MNKWIGTKEKSKKKNELMTEIRTKERTDERTKGKKVEILLPSHTAVAISKT